MPPEALKERADDSMAHCDGVRDTTPKREKRTLLVIVVVFSGTLTYNRVDEIGLVCQLGTAPRPINAAAVVHVEIIDSVVGAVLQSLGPAAITIALGIRLSRSRARLVKPDVVDVDWVLPPNSVDTTGDHVPLVEFGDIVLGKSRGIDPLPAGYDIPRMSINDRML